MELMLLSMSPLSDVMLDINEQTKSVASNIYFNVSQLSNMTQAWPDYNRVLQHQMKALLLSYSFIASRGSGLVLIKTGQ